MSERLREYLDKFKKLFREESPDAAARWWGAVVGQDPAVQEEWNKLVVSEIPIARDEQAGEGHRYYLMESME